MIDILFILLIGIHGPMHAMHQSSHPDEGIIPCTNLNRDDERCRFPRY